MTLYGYQDKCLIHNLIEWCVLGLCQQKIKGSSSLLTCHCTQKLMDFRYVVHGIDNPFTKSVCAFTNHIDMFTIKEENV